MPTSPTDRDAILASLEINEALRQLLQMMSNDLAWAKEELDPAVIQARLSSIAEFDVPPASPLTFDYTLNPTHVKLEWTSEDFNARVFEIRKGTTWETADFVLRTLSFDAELEPIATGSHDYLLKSITYGMVFCDDAVALNFFVPAIGTPTNLTTLVIDNHVLLDWDEPSSTFELSHYELYGGSDATTFKGYVDSTFYGFFEAVGASYQYGIIAVDIAGNKSPKAIISVFVQEPPDFVLEDEYDSTFDGTKVKCKLIDEKLLCTLDIAETWQEHFVDNSWASPQAQVSANYPIYIQPSEVSGGYYEEEHNWGMVYTDVIVNVAWTYEVIFSTVSVSCQIWGKKLVGDPWGDPISGVSGYFAEVQYIKIRLTFAPDDDKCLMWMLTLRFLLDVKKIMDAGEAIPDKTDGSGTEVPFNETFQRIDSVVGTTEDAEPLWVVIDKPEGADPVHFHVYVFDSEGQRVGDGSTGPIVYWTARGVR